MSKNDSPLKKMDEISDDSDDSLKIVINTPQKRRRTELNENDKQIIQEVEDILEESLGVKGAKSNLKITQIKHILKHVVTNEDVIALVRQVENPDSNGPVFEPKLTRAKAKELFTNVPCIPSKQNDSETKILFSEDLQEDSSGDEYIPGEEESEDERESSVVSESDSLSLPPLTPPTPSSQTEEPETVYTDDGVFKIPPLKSKIEEDDAATVALRTRSKINLSSTPLEVIEEAFIPPDITTDMYDMDCDDEDWTDFLKQFTRPLDEAIRPAEDEDHDPEYNILADEQIDIVDKEELRVDRAVKVSRKELNNLMAELFEFADIYEHNNFEEKELNISVPETTNLNISAPVVEPISQLVVGPPNLDTIQTVPSQSFEDIEKDVLIQRRLIPLLEQQMRQHVQMLTQNFLLTYKHPELDYMSGKYKEYLYNLKFLCEGKEASMFYTCNLFSAIKLIECYEEKFLSETEESKETILHFSKVLEESIKQKSERFYYVCAIPPLILETISKSDVFLYTSLLPEIAFKSKLFFSKSVEFFTESEDNLLASGLEQFMPIARKSKENINKRTGKVCFKYLTALIHEHVLPGKSFEKLYSRIVSYKQPRCSNNPIRYYFQYNKAPTIVHKVLPLNVVKQIPPCQRNPEELPHQFREYIFPNRSDTVTLSSNGSTRENIYTTVHTLNIFPTVGAWNTTYMLSGQPLLAKPCAPSSSTPSPLVTSTPYRKKGTLTKQNLNNSTPFRNTFALKNSTSSTLNCPAFKKQTSVTLNSPVVKKQTSISKFVEILCKPSPIRKILGLYKENNINSSIESIEEDEEMLPSMPNLFTPTKLNQNESEQEVTSTTELNASNILEEIAFKKESEGASLLQIDTVDTDNEKSESSNKTEIEPSTSTESVKITSFSDAIKSNVTIDFKDNAEEIHALMVASQTVKNTRKEPSGAEKKRAKTRREFLANISICSPEDPDLEKQKSENFALAYYDKIRETLELEDYHTIMQILNDHEEGDAVDLYKKIETVLRPKYSDLADEFLLFLRDREAAAVGQLLPWIRMSTRSKFLRKLETYFKGQPAQLRKIYKCLTELSQNEELSMEKVKNTLVPLFKGNNVLIDLFMQNFLCESPAASLLEGPYETFDISKEPQLNESVVIPDIDDKYGGSSCVCNCHKIEDPEFKSRYRHCIPCGTKFMQGKVFIQSGRGLRPATVSFLTNANKDHNIRLNGKALNKDKDISRRKRSEHVSPLKENCDEESDEDQKKKSTKTPRKRKKQPDKKSAVQKSPKSRVSLKSRVPKGTKTIKRSNSTNKKSPKRKTEKVVNVNLESDFEMNMPDIQLPKLDSTMEWDCDNSAESTETKPTSPEPHPVDSPEPHVVESPETHAPESPEPQTADSESEFCEESSQDNCESDSNSSLSSATHSQSEGNLTDELSWRRDEDKIILETFQKENDKEYAFTIISKYLKNRTVAQIRTRFQKLMTLLLEQLNST